MNKLNKPFDEEILKQTIQSFISENSLSKVNFNDINKAIASAETDFINNTPDDEEYNSFSKERISVYYTTAVIEFPEDFVSQHVVLSYALPGNDCYKYAQTNDEILEGIIRKFKLMKINYIKNGAVHSYLDVEEISYLRNLLNYYEIKNGIKENCLPLLINKINIKMFKKKNDPTKKSKLLQR